MSHCSAHVYRKHGSPYCVRAAVVSRDGKGYCKQHDPEVVVLRREASNKAWQADMTARAKGRRLQTTAPLLLAACKSALTVIAHDSAVGTQLRAAIAAAEKEV